MLSETILTKQMLIKTESSTPKNISRIISILFYFCTKLNLTQPYIKYIDFKKFVSRIIKKQNYGTKKEALKKTSLIDNFYQIPPCNLLS
ncbi:hypothetical protein CLU82_3698 [Flavobacterium sp. 5]|nr:hypothetical protein CLU82_3698 [Flavobacterium sp. 5]